MKDRYPYAHATTAGEHLILNLNITSLPVDPIFIAEQEKITVQPKPLETVGVSGMLIRANNTFCIVYATHIASVGFQRFSIAHELGHYFLPGHYEAVLDARGIHESHAGFVSGDKYEREADHFAAGLLMPRFLFVPAMLLAGEGLLAIEQLAKICQTSLSATAIRYVTCTDEPIAVVVSQKQRIEYCFMSPAIRAISDLEWVRKHDPLPKNSATFAFNKDPEKVRRGERADGSGDLRDWFGGHRGLELTEDIVGLGSYGKTLTVLFGIELPDEEEEEEEEALIESLTPRFHR